MVCRRPSLGIICWKGGQHINISVFKHTHTHVLKWVAVNEHLFPSIFCAWIIPEILLFNMDSYSSQDKRTEHGNGGSSKSQNWNLVKPEVQTSTFSVQLKEYFSKKYHIFHHHHRIIDTFSSGSFALSNFKSKLSLCYLNFENSTSKHRPKIGLGRFLLFLIWTLLFLAFSPNTVGEYFS